MRNLRLLLTAVLICAGTGLAQADTYVKVADEWGTIRPGGPVGGTSGSRFWTIQGNDGGSTFASAGTLRFYMDGLVSQLDADFGVGLWQVDSVAIGIDHSPFIDEPGLLSAFHFTNDTVAITSGNSPGDNNTGSGEFGDLPLSSLVYDDLAVSDGEKVRVRDLIFGTAPLGDVTRVNDFSYVFDNNGIGGSIPTFADTDVLGTLGAIDPAGAANADPNYGQSHPADSGDTLADFSASITSIGGAWLNEQVIIDDIEVGNDALSFIFNATVDNSDVIANYKGGPFQSSYPPRLYLEVSAIPEPTSLVLAFAGVAGCLVRRRS